MTVFETEAPNCLVTSLLTWPNLILPGSLLLGFYRDNGKENGNYYKIGGYRGYIGIMEIQMEAFVGSIGTCICGAGLFLSKPEALW